MSSFLDSGPVRAGAFFAAGLSVSVVLATFLGLPRLGVRMGVLSGLVLAMFGWLFVRPADGER